MFHNIDPTDDDRWKTIEAARLLMRIPLGCVHFHGQEFFLLPGRIRACPHAGQC
jgi:hypothetical protein